MGKDVNAGAWFKGFEHGSFEVNGVEIFARYGGRRDARPLLLLHGFPQTHAIWHRVAQHLKDEFFLVMPDLRGYGDSAKPPGLPDHANYSKRAMAQDMVELMSRMGFERFLLCGHDRGGRVAHRLALDHPGRVRKLCVIDVAPTLDMYEATNMAFARAYYHWFHLIQPYPVPETLIGADPQAYLRTLGGGNGWPPYFEPQAAAEYERCFCTREGIHGACEDYRASAGIDLDHDRESRAAGQKIACDMLALWAKVGVIESLFKPLALWRAQCDGQVVGECMPAGHFIPEQLHLETARSLQAFFG